MFLKHAILGRKLGTDWDIHYFKYDGKDYKSLGYTPSREYDPNRTEEENTKHVRLDLV